MIQELYVALLEAGVDEDKARNAAEVLDLDQAVRREILAGIERNVRLAKAALRRSFWIMVMQMVIVVLITVDLAKHWGLIP